MPDGSAAPVPSCVLVVDDDARWSDVVAYHVRREAVSVLVVGNGVEALATADEMQPQMIVVGLGLPSVDGLEVCRRLRAACDAYIILSTARCDEATILAGFAAGADDVLAHPFTSREAAARIEAILARRCPAPTLDNTVRSRAYDASGKQVFGPLSVDVGRREVFVADHQISLTRTQFDILATLVQRPGGVTTRQELLDAVWGPCWSGSANLIDVHIGHLRRRLGDNPARPLLVLNVRGIGYRLAGCR